VAVLKDLYLPQDPAAAATISRPEQQPRPGCCTPRVGLPFV